MKTIFKCPICNSRPLLTVKKKINQGRADVFLKASLSEYYLKLCNESNPSEILSICSNCRSIYRTKFFDDKEIEQIYGHLYHEVEKELSSSNGFAYNKKQILDGCSEKMFNTVKGLEKKFNFNIRRIFDIGGRDGFRLSKLADDGYVCVVFDPILCDPCNSKIMKDNKWAHEISLEEKADLISLCNVLEHCIDPYSIIQICYQHLNDNGILLIELPWDRRNALVWLIIKRFFGRNLGIDATHNVFYSFKGLTYLLEKVGFHNIEHNISFFPSSETTKVIDTIARKSSINK